MTRIIPAAARLLALLAFGAGLTACAMSMGVPRTRADALPVALFDAAGRAVGNVILTADSTGLDLRFDLHDLAPGAHGVHIHAAGRCERPDFLTAGAHLDDGTHRHGHANPEGWHLGDLPNLEVGPDGTARVTLRVIPKGTRFELKRILDGDGSAVIIHAGPDDERTDPSGGSGPRIACGIVA